MKSIKYSIIILATILLAWLLPKAYHLIADQPFKNTFVYYSSVDEAFCTIEYNKSEEQLVRKNIKTNKVYTESEFDSILPMFYTRQLLSDGRLPDTFNGRNLTPRQINSKKFFLRANPYDKNKPHIPLYTLFESISGRVKLETPGDFFRLNSRIEFIDPETNQVKQEKSELFNREFEKRGFQFPAKLAAGNPSTRKAYDEGYFIIDNSNQIFHLKMVNAMPFLKKVSLPEHVVPEHIITMEPADRSFYAFVFDTNKKLHIITTNKYQLEEIPIPDYNIDKDRLLIMANPLYWNVNVISDKGKTTMAIDAVNKKKVDEVSFEKPNNSLAAINYILPFSIKFTNSATKYISPHIQFGTYAVIITNLIMCLIFALICRYRKQKQQISALAWIAITGIYGFISNAIFR